TLRQDRRPPNPTASPQAQCSYRLKPFRELVTLKMRTLLSILVCALSFTSLVATAALPSWELAPPLPSPRVCLGVVEAEGDIYAIGGSTMHNRQWTDNDRVERFSPRQNTWTRLQKLPTPRGSFGIAAVDGKIYVIGGVCVVEGKEHNLNTVEVYDIASGTWKSGRPMPTPRQQLCAASVAGRIYVMGGKNAETVVEEYDPGSDTWCSRSHAPFQIRSATATPAGKHIYVIGGHRYDGKAVLVYDSQSDSWTRAKDMPTGRTDTSAAFCQGKIFVLGGHGHISNNEAYDPGSDSWSLCARLPEARGYHGAASVNGKIFLIGGALEILKGNEYSSVPVFTP
ncbi:MAG: kelch repeat-containing protein, partial [Opitutaceae bacterium]